MRAGHVDGLRAILRVRPDLVNRREPSGSGQVALHYAVLERMPEMVRALMEFGADARITTADLYALRHAGALPRFCGWS